jgi:hypothetical protein
LLNLIIAPLFCHVFQPDNTQTEHSYKNKLNYIQQRKKEQNNKTALRREIIAKCALRKRNAMRLEGKLGRVGEVLECLTMMAGGQ